MTTWRPITVKPGMTTATAVMRVVENIRLLGWDVRPTGKTQVKDGALWVQFQLPES